MVGPQAEGFDRVTTAPRPGPSSTGFPLSAARVPFPIEPSYEVKPDLQKLGNEPLLLEDANWNEWVADKARLLKQGGLVRTDSESAPDHLGHAIRAALAYFQRHLPNGPVDSRGHFPWLGGLVLDADDMPSQLAALSMSLQEDFALMRQTDSRGLRAIALSVAFPSGWDPGTKIGKSMLTIHEPVADNHRLQAATAAMSVAMAEKGPFVRYVWTLAGSNARARPVGVDDVSALTHAGQLWFRYERQVSVPLGESTSLFLIRVMHARFCEVVHDQRTHSNLVAALNSMSEQMLRYKNLHHAKRLVSAWARAASAPHVLESGHSRGE